MKNLANELRWLLAEYLLYIALNIAPKGKGRKELARFLSSWIPSQLDRQN